MKDLGVEYLDLYLIHFPISLKFVPFDAVYPPEWVDLTEMKMVEDPVPYSETWAAMEELVAEGLVKSIGVCNIGTTMLRDVLSYAKVKPAVLQIEVHPYNS
jgi:diketogulonate reductase-like aldo/keto reductase